jgi:SAM-dependent methyltransferase
VTDDLLIAKSERYRAASEALHRDTGAQDRHGANLRMLWACGLADLIRADFYGLFAFAEDARGAFLDAGCGTGIEMRNLGSGLPGLLLHGVDISSVALAHAVAESSGAGPRFYQSALETLPFANAVFDYIGSHEVIEHVEDPSVVLRELHRVLKPGGSCVIATPNGASLWVEHLRQRLARLLGRRGAPVGEDHVRPPSFWERQFAKAGFVVERRIFDGSAFEFLTYVAPARWMPLGVRLLEPLRIVPVVNLLLCDRVKYRLRKPGPPTESVATQPVCPLCHSELALEPPAARCRGGHRFGYNASGLVDFTTLLAPAAPTPTGAPASPAAAPRRGWTRRLRRYALAAGCVPYMAFLAALLPLGFAVDRVYRPLPRRTVASPR